MLKYKRPQLNCITDLCHLGLNDVKGYSYNSVIQGCGQRVALFLFLKTKTMKKKLKPVDLFIQNFVKTQKDCYYQLLKEMKAKKKSKLQINRA